VIYLVILLSCYIVILLYCERRNINFNTRLQFKKSTINELYVHHLYSLFKSYCGSKPITLSRFDDRSHKLTKYSSIKFQTLSLPCFNKYRDLFYNSQGVKFLSDNLEQLITVKGLDYWIMDDGYKSGKGLIFYI
jgi:LAGLIDADG DNA endonuclease family